MIIVKKTNGIWNRFGGTSNLDVEKIRSFYETGVWTNSDLAEFNLKAASPFTVPEGDKAVGEEYFEEIDGAVFQRFDTEPLHTKQSLKTYTAQKRKQITDSATIVDLGEVQIPVWTDAESRVSITAIAVALQIDPTLIVSWKGADGEFYDLSAQELSAVAMTMLGFIQACFEVEKSVVADIENGVITLPSEVDEAMWPTTYEAQQ